MHSGGGGKPKHAREKDEEQFILRLPEALSAQMRLGLGSKSKRDAAGSEAKFAVHFTSERDAFFLLNGTRYPASLYDFPCIVETHKTADKRTYFKSGDVHQVLVVRMPDDPPPSTTGDPPSSTTGDPPSSTADAPHPHQLPHGITPAAQHAATRFHVPPTVFSADQVESVENQMKYVVDNKVAFVRKKQEPTPPPQDDADDVIIEADAGEAPEPAPPAPAVASAAPSPAPSTPFPMSPFPASAPSPAPGTAPGTPAVLTPGPAGSPSPAPTTPAPLTPAPLTPAPLTPAPAVNEEEDDMFLEELAGEIIGGGDTEEREAEEALKRIERTTLDGKIEEQRGKIRAVQEQAGKAPNPVLKNRILAKVPELETALKELESARAKLD